MRKVFLSESHPEAGTLDGREVLHQRFELFVEQQIRVARTDVRIRQGLMDFHRLRLHPLSVLVITSVLSNFADVDFRIEVCGKSLMMISRIAVHDVQVMDFIEIMFGRVCRIHTGNARVETAAQNGGQSSFLETFLVGPLPTVFKMSHVLRLVVCRIQIIASGLQTSFHNGQVLIRQGQIHHHVRFVTVQQFHQLFHIVGVHLCRLDRRVPDGLHDSVTLGLRTAGNHDFVKHFRMLGHFVRCYRGHTAGTDN